MNSLKLADARHNSPPVNSDLADGLCATALESISESDVGDMMRAVVSKAKKGDVTACKFVLDFLGKHAGQPRRVVMADESDTPAALAGSGETATERNIYAMRLEILARVAEHGPAKTSMIAHDLGLAGADVREAIRGHQWFDCQAAGVHLSDKGWAEARKDGKETST